MHAHVGNEAAKIDQAWPICARAFSTFVNFESNAIRRFRFGCRSQNTTREASMAELISDFSKSASQNVQRVLFLWEISQITFFKSSLFNISSELFRVQLRPENLVIFNSSTQLFTVIQNSRTWRKNPPTGGLGSEIAHILRSYHKEFRCVARAEKEIRNLDRFWRRCVFEDSELGTFEMQIFVTWKTKIVILNYFGQTLFTAGVSQHLFRFNCRHQVIVFTRDWQAESERKMSHRSSKRRRREKHANRSHLSPANC